MKTTMVHRELPTSPHEVEKEHRERVFHSSGHGTYFEREHLERSFEQIYQDMQNSDPCWHSVCDILTTHHN